MRHLVKGKKLGRNTSHRKATMKALACNLIEHKSIRTTVAKAKELRRYVEPIITKAKEDTSHTRRQVFSSLQDKRAVNTLFNDVMPEVGDRPGGYTRVLKLGFRLGDSAEMALIELVDFSEYEPEKKSAKKKRTRRAGKSNKPTTSSDDTQEQDEETKKEASAAAETEVKEKATKAEATDDVAENDAEEVDTKDVKDQTEEASEDDSDDDEKK
mgnify:CR=1 FL=1